MLAAKFLPGASLAGPWLWPIAGRAVGSTGVGLRAWAIVSLGEQFTRQIQVTDDHQLVIHGPCRYVRHPSYTGAILIFPGIGIGLANIVSLVACLILPPIGYLQRIPRERHC